MSAAAVKQWQEYRSNRPGFVLRQVSLTLFFPFQLQVFFDLSGTDCGLRDPEHEVRLNAEIAFTLY